MDLQAMADGSAPQEEIDPENDMYYIAYVEAREDLVRCHTSKGRQSCLSCDQVLSCDIRTKYVEATYSNMTKGEYGDFDFN